MNIDKVELTEHETNELLAVMKNGSPQDAASMAFCVGCEEYQPNVSDHAQCEVCESEQGNTMTVRAVVDGVPVEYVDGKWLPDFRQIFDNELSPRIHTMSVVQYNDVLDVLSCEMRDVFKKMKRLPVAEGPIVQVTAETPIGIIKREAEQFWGAGWEGGAEFSLRLLKAFREADEKKCLCDEPDCPKPCPVCKEGDIEGQRWCSQCGALVQVFPHGARIQTCSCQSTADTDSETSLELEAAASAIGKDGDDES